MTIDTIKKFFLKISGFDKVLIIIFVLGVVVASVSLFRGILVDSQVQVEYINSPENKLSGNIFVDIEGAVINPGVYQLQDGSRVKDVLVSAGGMSEKADRTFCEKNINLAELVKDGEKIYIPSTGVTPVGGGYVEPLNEAKMINVNIATIAQLDTLWGVGPTRAESIVKNRPYKNLDELVKKGAMTKAIFEKNKEILSLY